MNGWSSAQGSLNSRLTRFVSKLLLAGLVIFSATTAQAVECNRTLTADVVAFDMPLMWNRLGAQNINGMMYALRRDVVRLSDNVSLDQIPDLADVTDTATDGQTVFTFPFHANISDVDVSVNGVRQSPAAFSVNLGSGTVTFASGLSVDDAVVISFPGSGLAGLGGGITPQVTLRPDKRPRPLVLRAGAGDCLAITLTNLLTSGDNPLNAVEERSGIPFKLDINDQVAGRKISLRFQGTHLADDISDDGSYVGENDSSLVDVGDTDTFKIHARKDGAFVGTSYGHTLGGEGLGGTTASGLFAVLNVNAKGAGFFRSQLTNEELLLAVNATSLESCPSTPGFTCQGHPILNWLAVYPDASPWIEEGKAGLPIINMVTPGGEIVHSDLNAIVAFTGADFT
ncbi:MAG: hypothetical protein OEO82_00585, partial [Gammaproteobacteria bacterium]|nr:hypothetical protein [Gammaproteobacteria bacterium]